MTANPEGKVDEADVVPVVPHHHDKVGLTLPRRGDSIGELNLVALPDGDGIPPGERDHEGTEGSASMVRRNSSGVIGLVLSCAGFRGYDSQTYRAVQIRRISDLEDLRHRCHETRDDGHGRIDERSCFLAEVPRDLAPGKDRPWIEAIGHAAPIARHVATGTESDEVRYDLSGRSLSGKRFGEAVRGHWGIEPMHRVLDVNFGEVEHRTRER